MVEESVVEEEAADEVPAEAETEEAPVAEAEPAPVAEETPAGEKPVEEMPPLPPEALEPLLAPEPEPVGAGTERLSSLRDLPENTWSTRRSSEPGPGQIRFAEEIVGLRGGVMARRGRTGDGGGGRRKSKGGRKRR